MIGGAGWAVMAWRLAISRVPHASSHVRYSVDRETVERSGSGCFPVHREYYRIIDEAWRGWHAVQRDILMGGIVPGKRWYL